MLRRSCLALLLAGFCGSFSFAEDWPGWRGPRRDGTATGTGYATKWTDSENIHWKVEIPGVGHSSPVISKGKVFLTTCLESVEEKEKPRVLLCLDRANGKKLWEQTLVKSPLEKKHKLNSYSSSTPMTDGEHVYVPVYDAPAMRIFCYDTSGKKIWEKNPGEFHSVHGFCTSPLLHKDLLIVNADQDPQKDGKAYIVALDKKTGEEKWRINRPNRLRSYCPPILIEVEGKTQMVLTGSKCVTSYNPEDGTQNWIVKGPTEQFVSSMVYHENVLFLTAGFPVHWVMAIDPKGKGDITDKNILWSKKNEGGYVPSPVANGGKFWVVADDGIATCWNAKSGEMLFKERLGAHQTGSGVSVGDHVYFTDDNGITYVLNTKADKLDVLFKNPIKEKCFSSPAFSDGDIFLRGEKHLFCIREAKAK
jgi:outer membrane protein assembly factor BamB